MSNENCARKPHSPTQNQRLKARDKSQPLSVYLRALCTVFEANGGLGAVAAEAGRKRRKDTPIVVYCGANIRSPLAAHTLQLMGYTNVRNYADGFIGWRKLGLQVE